MNLSINFRSYFSILFIVLFAFIFTTCGDDESIAPLGDPKTTTTVKIQLTEFPDSTITTFMVRDTNADEIQLKANTSYIFRLSFLDESNASDIKDFTEQIAIEGPDYLVCISMNNDAPAPMPASLDIDGQIVGLVGGWITEGAASGNMIISLQHEPDKSAAVPCSTGVTDVEVSFPFVIQ